MMQFAGHSKFSVLWGNLPGSIVRAALWGHLLGTVNPACYGGIDWETFFEHLMSNLPGTVNPACYSRIYQEADFQECYGVIYREKQIQLVMGEFTGKQH